ncbi:hypothetical protein GLAREA_07783 [Glarea lozoyensis ATCC 20868]|uniref:Uncharacterized protein n=1 Tax=Glarea lozoyensis (strain ATCC 20868 / MF5171) TaxID=1116229 RepID=S3D691_GLAL2|nr:uncharacterized protein GLAREA_07783 [Glarea lozoyensis ATCC 20868]EPE32649.1 hypothetical protein GLAREA_07783 [Glarea lozoyensis ATCC 20868]
MDSPPETPEQTQNYDSSLPGTQQDSSQLSEDVEDGSSDIEQELTSSPKTVDGGMEPSQDSSNGLGKAQVQVPSTPRPNQIPKLERSPSQTQRKLAFPRTQPNHVIKHVTKLESSQLRQNAVSRPPSQAHKAAKVEQLTQQEPESAQRDEPSEAYEVEEQQATSGHEKNGNVPQDTSVELEDFDYAEIERKYREELKAVHKEEKQYFNDLESYGRLAGNWAAGASARDNERAFKRLKTRERFVQLSEDTLQAKHEHYSHVYTVLQSAIDLISSGAPK